MTDVLRCRIYEDGDLPGVLSLWDSQSGWGTINAEMWRAWNRDTPWGDTIISVLVDDDNQNLGQMVFTPLGAWNSILRTVTDIRQAEAGSPSRLQASRLLHAPRVWRCRAGAEPRCDEIWTLLAPE